MAGKLISFMLPANSANVLPENDEHKVNEETAAPSNRMASPRLGWSPRSSSYATNNQPGLDGSPGDSDSAMPGSNNVASSSGGGASRAGDDELSPHSKRLQHKSSMQQLSRRVKIYMKAPRIVFRGHQQPILSVSVVAAPDNTDTFIISGSEDKLVKVWSLAKGELLATLEGHLQRVSGVTGFRAVGFPTLAISASWDDTVRIWNLDAKNTTGEVSPPPTVRGDAPGIERIAEADGSGSHSNSNSNSNSPRGRDVRPSKSPPISSSTAGTGEADGAGAGSTPDHNARHFTFLGGHTAGHTPDYRTGNGERSWYTNAFSPSHIIGHGGGPSSSSSAAGGAAAGGGAGTHGGHSGQHGALLARRVLSKSGIEASCVVLRGHKNRVYCVTTLLDGPAGFPIAASGSADNTIRTWSLPKGVPLQVLENSDVYTWNLCIAACRILKKPKRPFYGPVVVTGCKNNTVCVWQLEPEYATNSLLIIRGHSSAVQSLAVFDFEEDPMVVTVCRDLDLRVWSMLTGELMKIMKGHTSIISSVSAYNLSKKHGGVIIVSSSVSGSIRGWKYTTGEVLRIFNGHTDEVNVIASFKSPEPGKTDELVIVSGSRDCTLRTWLLADEKSLRVLQHSDEVSRGNQSRGDRT